MDKIKAYFVGMHRSWTVYLGYLLLFLPVVQSQWDVWGVLVPEKLRPFALSILGMIIIGLRFKTTQSLADK